MFTMYVCFFQYFSLHEVFDDLRLLCDNVFHYYRAESQEYKVHLLHLYCVSTCTYHVIKISVTSDLSQVMISIKSYKSTNKYKSMHSNNYYIPGMWMIPRSANEPWVVNRTCVFLCNSNVYSLHTYNLHTYFIRRKSECTHFE